MNRYYAIWSFDGHMDYMTALEVGPPEDEVHILHIAARDKREARVRAVRKARRCHRFLVPGENPFYGLRIEPFRDANPSYLAAEVAER